MKAARSAFLAVAGGTAFLLATAAADAHQKRRGAAVGHTGHRTIAIPSWRRGGFSGERSFETVEILQHMRESRNRELINSYLSDPDRPKLVSRLPPVPRTAKFEASIDCPAGCYIEQIGSVEFQYFSKAVPLASLILSYMAADRRGDGCDDGSGRNGIHTCVRRNDYFAAEKKGHLRAAREDYLPIELTNYRLIYYRSTALETSRYMRVLLDLAAAPDPPLCNSAYVATIGIYVGRCGVFRSVSADGGRYILYCALTKVPGITPTIEGCTPLAYRSAGAWRLAYIGAAVMDLGGGGTDTFSFCGNKPATPRFRQSLAQLIGMPLVGSPLRITAYRKGSYYFGGEALNVPLVRLTNGEIRGWGYIKFWAILRDGNDFEINFEYLNSPRRMSSRSEAMQPTEAQAGSMERAITRRISQAVDAAATMEGAKYPPCAWGG